MRAESSSSFRRPDRPDTPSRPTWEAAAFAAASRGVRRSPASPRATLLRGCLDRDGPRCDLGGLRCVYDEHAVVELGDHLVGDRLGRELEPALERPRKTLVQVEGLLLLLRLLE